MTRIACDDFRQFVDAYLDAEFDERDRAGFDAHLASCSPCRCQLESQIAFRRALRPHLQRPSRLPEPARAALRAKLRVASRPARAALWARRLAVPLPAAAAVGALLLLVTPLTGFTLADEVIDQHCQRVPIEVPSPQADEVDEWFRDKVPFQMAAPRFRDRRVQLLGGRLSRVGGRQGEVGPRKAAYLVYGVGRHKMTVLVFDGRDIDVSRRGDLRHVRGHDLTVHEHGTYRVALYREGPVTYAVTSDLPETEMLDLVASAF